MSRRHVGSARRFVDSGNFPFSSALHPKSRSSPLISIALLVVGSFLLIAYAYGGPGLFRGNRDGVGKIEGDYTCTAEVQKAIPYLKKAYGDNMRKVLHVGPDTCGVVLTLLKEDETEPWGLEPYDMDDSDASCKNLVRKGLVRVADIKFPLPYKPKSFSLVIVSDALDYLSPMYLNRTLPELARVAMDGLVIFTGHPGQQRAKVTELSKFGRPPKMRSSSWWIRYFVQTSLQENEVGQKKFDQAAFKRAYKPNCQVFHLKPYR
ncbi:Probable pectin methylesterase CGR2 [Linum perenne]